MNLKAFQPLLRSCALGAAAMGFEAWATFVVAAAALSAFKRRDEIAVTLNAHVILPNQDDQRALFGAWWPCMLTSVVIMLVLTQSYRLGLLSRKVARKAIHFSEQPSPCALDWILKSTLRSLGVVSGSSW